MVSIAVSVAEYYNVNQLSFASQSEAQATVNIIHQYYEDGKAHIAGRIRG